MYVTPGDTDGHEWRGVERVSLPYQGGFARVGPEGLCHPTQRKIPFYM